ncbi:phosphatase PAP2 family protein [Clostridium botulinum]|uniref:Phospholipid phosphatase n=1 Tax=Clostridium botulinum C/D str. DC5 TaxID=1443128 RepID=A0A0A0I3Q2_CLOBO|nr:phosphatase PAP2 family protein [Clostridium botulinum]KEI00712.1 phospholipid phosphatase [Clostridium botulinum C/D str. BKT75002]KEI08458.1 phospholipid phosphatase [Clostridium botulinum C/D str. BKT2873]KGM96034.1 phospholipid phosphatase [Clostridium botulinum C/D str. DC5]KGM96717.1 phospholipid phosphatase [Clostridium botulinum D str. CCUG 7971]KOC51277.1 phospholipid phosphatase [Clostridium botulinum]
MKKLFQNIKTKDASILKLINNSMNCKILDFIMTPITYLGSLTFCIVFCLITIFNSNRHIHLLGITAATTLIISSFIGFIIKNSVNRLRPFIHIKNLNIKKIGIDKYSFPSGHTTAAFSISTIISLSYPHTAIISTGIASCVGLSRLYLGVHYPTDVLCGVFLGSITSFIVFYSI